MFNPATMNYFPTYSILGGLLLLTLLACEREVVEDVHPSFQQYVDRFIEEAALRGQDIDFLDTGLSIQFRDAVDQETGGVCYTGDHRIEIEKFFWDDLTDLQREGLIFHELGHCELGRGHRNTLLPNGEWASRMRGSPIPDDLSPVINYTPGRRDYYLDELFDPDTPFPDWASLTVDYDEVSEAQREVQVDIPGPTRSFEERLLITSVDDFEIEFEVDAGLSESWVGVQWNGNDPVNAIFLVYTARKRFLLESGNNVWGIMRSIEEYEKLKTGFNKFTIRRQGARYYVFLNEEFIYWFDYSIPASNTVRSLVAGTVSPTYQNIRLSKLVE